MLTKNVYILYPAGYSGSYLNWSISISDKDLCSSTVKDPINTVTSTQFGGQGTAHNHIRVPTHQDVYQHLAWVVLNRPTDKKIYLINDSSQNVYYSIRYLMQSDPDGVFVVIHNNDDQDVDAYGTINCITKWPVFSEGRIHLLNVDPREEKFDWFGSSNAYRNFIVKNHETFFIHMKKLDHDILNKEIGKSINWYRVRNKFNPHEVNELTYITDYSLDRRLFDISCADIASDNFPQWLEKFMNSSSISDAYDCSYVADQHTNYIQAQPNLKWFDSIRAWEATGELDSYLTSHCGIEAHVILRILKNSNAYFPRSQYSTNWFAFYNNVKASNWPAVSSNESDFYILPKWIQDEILYVHGYRLTVANDSGPATLYANWENMSVEEINQVYQDFKQKKAIV